MTPIGNSTWTGVASSRFLKTKVKKLRRQTFESDNDANTSQEPTHSGESSSGSSNNYNGRSNSQKSLRKIFPYLSKRGLFSISRRKPRDQIRNRPVHRRNDSSSFGNMKTSSDDRSCDFDSLDSLAFLKESFENHNLSCKGLEVVYQDVHECETCDSNCTSTCDVDNSTNYRASMMSKDSARRLVENVESLAVTRTPSFNCMLHANEHYSDSSTLVKRASARITWMDLQRVMNETDDECHAEIDIESDVEDENGQDDSYNAVGNSIENDNGNDIDNTVDKDDVMDDVIDTEVKVDTDINNENEDKNEDENGFHNENTSEQQDSQNENVFSEDNENHDVQESNPMRRNAVSFTDGSLVKRRSGILRIGSKIVQKGESWQELSTLRDSSRSLKRDSTIGAHNAVWGSESTYRSNISGILKRDSTIGAHNATWGSESTYRSNRSRRNSGKSIIIRDMVNRASNCEPDDYEREGSNRGGVPIFAGTSVVSVGQDFEDFVRNERCKEWLWQFRCCDPRYRILKFFNDVANEGATGNSAFERTHVSPLLKYFSRSSVFTVWRPTSKDAIRRMMLGQGVGKGLDIKGKSAKRGVLSAFVPFLQIHKEEDKAKVRTLRKDGTIRVFFDNEQNRDTAVKTLNEVAKEMEETVRQARDIINNADDYDDDVYENALEKLTLEMSDSTIHTIDDYAASNKYGMTVNERLFWEGMVVRQNIERKPGSENDTGRTSMPSFQDMNFDAVRKPKNCVAGGHTRAVILQLSNPPRNRGTEPESNTYDPMSPLNLVVAYEEKDPEMDRKRIIPVVSDFDCFIVGSRNVNYEEQVPDDQVDVLKWMVEQTEHVLETPNEESWTKRWLNVLKDARLKGCHHEIPTGGYSDPKTKFIFKFAIERLSVTGAVRHGAECFNYYFPQDLDDKLLVISDDLPNKYKGCRWVYVDQFELQEILKYKISHGFSFPLNPKWILCDPGWKEVYDKLISSDRPDVQKSMRCWYPPESGIRESIERIYKKHPNGFERQFDESLGPGVARSRISTRLSYVDGTTAMDLAEQELKYFMILQRAKRRLKVILLLNRMLSKIRECREMENHVPISQKEEQNERNKSLPDPCTVAVAVDLQAA